MTLPLQMMPLPPSPLGLLQRFKEEEGDDSGEGGDSDGAMPGDTDPGLIEFMLVLGGLSQAFEETQVTYSPWPIQCASAHIHTPHMQGHIRA